MNTAQDTSHRPAPRNATAPAAHPPPPARPARELHPALVAGRMLLILSLLTGVLYPLAITGIASIAFRGPASGSLLLRHGQPVGSTLLAQRMTSDRYFWPRPSAGDDGTQYPTVPSSASNLGPTSSNLVALARTRADRFRAAHRLPDELAVPPDMLFASGSGLDPHLSPQSARLQVARVARARHLDAATTAQLHRLVDELIEPPQLGFLGEPRLNVFLLNLALDQLP